MRKRIPYIQQLEISDCGAACLAMNLALHGRHVNSDELRKATKTSRSGVDAISIIKAASLYGLEARGVKVDLDAIRHLDRGTILHWEFNHFVVLDRVTRAGIEILDPAIGRIRVSRERFSRSFTGVAITLRPTEDFSRNEGRTRGAWRYLIPTLRRSKLLPKVVVSSLMIQLFALATPILTGTVVDRVVPQANRSLLYLVSLGLLVMVVFHLLSSFVRSHLLLSMRAQIDLELSTHFVSHLMRLPYSFFLQRTPGDLMTRVNSNATVREILTTGSISTLLDGLLVSAYLVLIFAQDPSIGVLVLALAALQLIVLIAAHKPIQRLMAEVLLAQARSQGHMTQLINGIETLKSIGAEERAVSRWSGLFIDEVNSVLARGRVNALVESATGTLRVASPLLILGVGALRVLDGEMTLGTMLALSALAVGFLTPLSNLIASTLQMQLLSSYMERINDVLDTPPEQDLEQVAAAGKLSGHIELRDVSFRYEDGGPDVVANVSLEIGPGHSVGIVGSSGSGKSTLAQLLLGLYRPDQGVVLYDGVDIRGLAAASVRRQLGIVPQHSYLFASSIRDNITLTAPDATMEQVEKAARLACIHDEIADMPLGYETVLSDAGASISGGQRQRIALARALIHEPAILLLDEATSSLDSLTEAAIYENLESLDCTRIVIAHRISTIARADLILVMEDGRFIEQGTHEELIAAAGRYFMLASSQERSSPPR